MDTIFKDLRGSLEKATAEILGPDYEAKELTVKFYVGDEMTENLYCHVRFNWYKKAEDKPFCSTFSRFICSFFCPNHKNCHPVEYINLKKRAELLSKTVGTILGEIPNKRNTTEMRFASSKSDLYIRGEQWFDLPYTNELQKELTMRYEKIEKARDMIKGIKIDELEKTEEIKAVLKDAGYDEFKKDLNAYKDKVLSDLGGLKREELSLGVYP